MGGGGVHGRAACAHACACIARPEGASGACRASSPSPPCWVHSAGGECMHAPPPCACVHTPCACARVCAHECARPGPFLGVCVWGGLDACVGCRAGSLVAVTVALAGGQAAGGRGGGGVPQDSLSRPDVPVPGMGLWVGGQLEVGDTHTLFLISTFLLLPPAPQPSPPPPGAAPHPGVWQQPVGGRGLGGVWRGCAWGGVRLRWPCSSRVQGGGAPPHPQLGGHSAMGDTSIPEPWY